ncbi:hypothetical protein GH5_03864 [Leishmania sp. Ghana 2012 LV757]|uniref:hypothetical protein n=1 Tax=Leishmania sp. Ghana 2012 LV757 TaxID=2803181 RepID=UPI001B587749|nr:hypothetical protein GH5_03864 [Leishmania sp. Ghana 2012 LV757]
MPLSQKGPVSGFAAAAKVLFDSAQRVGAVEPLEHSTKQYAQQLKKIQSHSKRRGGSLGGVSYKVAEFLAAQRPSAPQQTRPGPAKERTIAKRVPLIEIPCIPANMTAGKTSATERERRPPLAPPPSLNSLFAKKAVPSKEEVSAPPPPLSPVATEAATLASCPAEEVLITEDKPLFEVRPQVEPQRSPEAVIQPAFACATPQEASRPIRKAKPVISIPIASVGAAVVEAAVDLGVGSSSPDGAAAVAGFSVDVWEQQRERELERLQKKQEEEEQRRLTLLREQEHQTLGKEWVDRRTYKISFEAEPTLGGKLLRKLCAADSAAAALSTFQMMIDSGTRTSALLPAALAAVAYNIRAAHPAEQLDLKRALLDTVEKAKLPEHLMRKAHLLVSGGTDFLTAFGALTVDEKQHLDSRIILRAIKILTWNERWEEALELAKQSRSNFRSGSDVLDLTLLRASQLLEEGPRKEIVAYATRSLTESGRMGVHAKLLIASAERGAYRRTLLKQLTASSDVDESVYAELILRSDRSQTEGLLAEIAARGLNSEDPVVLGAVAMKALNTESPADAFKEIDRQVAKIGLRPMHIRVATMTAVLHPTEVVLRQASAVVQMAPPAARGPGLHKLLPVLYQQNMLAEIVELADSTNESVPVAKLLPRAVAFVNEALLKVGRKPLNDVRVSDIGFSRASGEAAASLPSKLEEEAASVIVDIAGLTEKLLLFAKERQWAKALDVVNGLPTAIKADASAVTLLYNCALGAAVEHAEKVKSIYALMGKRRVKANPTTVNTVLSSLSKSSLWEEALQFFNATPLDQRDNNTYLVYFALLGKQNLWKQAMEAYDETRAAIPKVPAAMFSLIIGTTSGHDWHATLRIFQDMLRTYGSSVKESVVTQVVRCLERNNKTAEIAKLEKEVAKRRKKKK